VQQKNVRTAAFAAMVYHKGNLSAEGLPAFGMAFKNMFARSL
jgi:hypothetical protein